MASRQQLEVEADGVDIETLWRALTKDRLEIFQKAAPGFLTEMKILEGDGFALGSLLCISFGPGAPNQESLKARIVEFDERKHVLTFLGVGEGHMNLGFTHYLESLKLDDAGGGKTVVNASITYDLKENFDGSQLLDGFLKLLRHYLGSIISYLQQKHED
ncbi:hypothetical protein KSP39_PZI010165 [Platanthera zijinensis]|uniref:Bet v I/Major latex protein domain-containing protein n=1 Tax=Platanthera zijinensis TaxID=2320716 RepID=A0AAP0BIX5_9ASPA